jgi:hypothetical protein
VDDQNTSTTAGLIWGVSAIAAELMPVDSRTYSNKKEGDGPDREETALRSVRHLIDSGYFNGAIGKIGGMIFADRAKLHAIINERIENFEAKREAKAKAREERQAKVVAMAAAGPRRRKRHKAKADHFRPEAG